jgi:hypothetical protein
MGLQVQDRATPTNQSEGILRQITWDGALQSGKQLYALLAEGTAIKDMGANRFSVDGQYYLQTFPSTAGKAFIRESKGVQQLVMALSGKEISYELIF